ncbi:MAG TPA: dihydroorotate dehydrogenase electron transfer subunit [Candidatus Aminicenantes bacterium]|nr:dihydroorotate dehydrogenase electron transfer subunit [Candidatus Aminicenantes bacterium]
MVDAPAILIENTALGGGFHLLRLECDPLARQAKPGQFAMIRVARGHDPLLRRPLGILRTDPPHVWFYFQVVGRGTELLAAARPGDVLPVLGPLGNTVPEWRDRDVVLVAGGRGVVPVFFAAERLAKGNRLHVVYGARDREGLHLAGMLAELPGIGLSVCTDDGSAGERGLVTPIIARLLTELPLAVTFSCGPERMLAALARELPAAPERHFVSLEALMGCGFGACHGCAVPAARGGYLRVCEEGPIFPLEAVQWPT